MYRSSPSVPTGQKSRAWQPMTKKEPRPAVGEGSIKANKEKRK